MRSIFIGVLGVGLAVIAAGAKGPESGGRRRDMAGASGDARCRRFVLDPEEELAASPRADGNLEALALELSKGAVADQPIYDRLVRDIGAIRSLEPAVASISYSGLYDPSSVMIEGSPELFQKLKAGTYDAPAFECLAKLYGLKRVDVDSLRRLELGVLEFDGVYNTVVVAKQVRSLPGVLSATPGPGMGDGPTICLGRARDLWHYVLVDASGDCMSGCIEHHFFYFVSRADGSVEARGRFDEAPWSPARPAWLRYCMRQRPDWFEG